MNKFMKWVLAGIGTLVVLFVIAAIVLPLAVDPNNYKDEIRTAVLDKTGRELTIGGEIKWTVFPWIGLEISRLELGNRAGFGDQPMLSIGAAGASVKLMPLFSKKVELGKVKLSDMSIYLRRNADGQNNWQDLSDTQSTTTSASTDSGDIDAFIVSEIEISNTSVSWDDAGQITELKGFHLNAAHIELGRPFDLKGGFSVNLAASGLTGEAQFEGRVQSSPDGARYSIEGLNFGFNGKQGSNGDTVVLDMTTKADVDIDLDEDRAKLSNFTFQLHDMVVGGELNVTSLSGEPKFSGGLRLEEFNPRSLMTALGVQAPPTANDEALTSLQAEMDFSGSSNSANMQNLSLKFDQSAFKGHMKVNNFTQPRLAFDFEIDSLNLDNYLAGAEVEAEESDLTVDLFRGFTGGGDLRIGELLVAGLKATEVSMKMSSDGNIIRFSPINAAFYGGQHQGDVKIDASGSQPILIARQTLSGVQAEGFLQDLTGSARLQGNGDFNLNIRTDLTNSQTTLQTLSGELDLSVLDGAIVGIDVADSIRKAKAAFGQQADSSSETTGEAKTEFAELTMTGVFDQGILSSDDLNMRSPLLLVTGKGRINLVEETINYSIKPVLTDNLDGQSTPGLGELSGVPVPVKISGNLYEPDISVDIVAAIAGTQKARIDEKKDELKDKVFGKLLGEKDDSETADKQMDTEDKDDPAKSLLKGLFGSKRNKEETKDEDGDGGNS